MRVHLDELMAAARTSLTAVGPFPHDLPIKVGVDLGTAYTVMMVTDESDRPLAGASVFADVVRDGVVWDFAGAHQVVASLKHDLESRIGRTIAQASVTIPPAVDRSNHRAHQHVLEAAGIECLAVVDEPSAANAVLGINNGAVVDIGGGTTGIAIVADGQVIATVDEPSGGTHLSLVISGSQGISYDEAEVLKRDPANHRALFGAVLPVMQKMASIVADSIRGHHVSEIHFVGGTSAFTGLGEVMTRTIGVSCIVAPDPMLVTPLGVAQWCRPFTERQLP